MSNLNYGATPEEEAVITYIAENFSSEFIIDFEIDTKALAELLILEGIVSIDDFEFEYEGDDEYKWIIDVRRA